MILYIKNMICLRCKIVVESILADFGLHVNSMSLGEIHIKETIPYSLLRQVDKVLRDTGLELVYDKKNMIDQKIKSIIVETFLYSVEPLNIKFSHCLASRMNYSYTYLSNIFSEMNGISIEQYVILQKIEKVKSMLIAERICLSKIACQMHYSSVGHLSAQFKKVTGYTAREYRLIKQNSHKQLPVLIAV